MCWHHGLHVNLLTGWIALVHSHHLFQCPLGCPPVLPCLSQNWLGLRMVGQNHSWAVNWKSKHMILILGGYNCTVNARIIFQVQKKPSTVLSFTCSEVTPSGSFLVYFLSLLFCCQCRGAWHQSVEIISFYTKKLVTFLGQSPMYGWWMRSESCNFLSAVVATLDLMDDGGTGYAHAKPCSNAILMGLFAP